MNSLPQNESIADVLAQPIPDATGATVFDAPWQVRAIAIVAALQRNDLLTRSEWAGALADQIRGEHTPPQGNALLTYYAQALRALQQCLRSKGLADVAEVARLQTAWARAQVRTPHGQPLELRPEDFGPGSSLPQERARP